ncbi:MAG: CPBP family intramembrane glutamic endopeptidase, partial [Mycetocola sp.]
VQAVLFTVFAGLLRPGASIVDLSLFMVMGVVLGYLRRETGSVWMSVGFHAAFQWGSQLALTHGTVSVGGDSGLAMLILGVIPFTAVVIYTSVAGTPRAFRPGPDTAR